MREEEWLNKKKYRESLCRRGTFLGVAQDGIEPPTQGFSVLCSTD